MDVRYDIQKRYPVIDPTIKSNTAGNNQQGCSVHGGIGNSGCLKAVSGACVRLS